MIVNSFYLSDETNVELFMEMTDLSYDEVESLVGRFKKDHWRFAGKLMGEVIEYASGRVIVRHHFTKKKYPGAEFEISA